MSPNEPSSREPVHLQLTTLEKQVGTITLLVLLQQFGDLYYTELSELGMNQQTIMRARKVLIDYGLLTTYDRKMGRTTRVYHSLTPKREKVARKLLEIEELL
ncbi:MAG: hypothetical protein GF308_05835 [Candidatus Heimdallarchaeota archaeon]|nr:hypothetical protein [Candidatus Heimdallarchaeota archaeon]